MSSKFPILKNVTTGIETEITNSPFTIGRGLASNLIIEDPIISRTHCSFFKTTEGWILRDSSTNGTFVNDKHYCSQITPILKHNDDIGLSIGNYLYKFVLESDNIPKRILNNDVPSSPSIVQFEISDDLFNQLADNILNKIEKNETKMEIEVTGDTNIGLNPHINSSCMPKRAGLEQSSKHIFDIKSNENPFPSSLSQFCVQEAGSSNTGICVEHQFVDPVSEKSGMRSVLQSGEVVESSMRQIPIHSSDAVNDMKQIGDCTTKEHSSQQPSTSKQSEVPESFAACEQNQFEEMEDELMCAICANLFIKAVTLNCSHSFCQYCIGKWKQKKSECPICRKKITSTTRTLVLDNIIEKMLDNAPLEMKVQRKDMLEERQIIEKVDKCSNQSKGRVNPQVRGSRTNNRSRRGRGRGPNQTPPAAVIEIHDSSPSSDSDSFDESELSGSYYDSDWYERNDY